MTCPVLRGRAVAEALGYQWEQRWNPVYVVCVESFPLLGSGDGPGQHC